VPVPKTAFDALFAQVMTGAERFGHRQHIHLTWLAVCRYGTRAAITLVSFALRGSPSAHSSRELSIRTRRC
jgi:hypothetical protein